MNDFDDVAILKEAFALKPYEKAELAQIPQMGEVDVVVVHFHCVQALCELLAILRWVAVPES